MVSATGTSASRAVRSDKMAEHRADGIEHIPPVSAPHLLEMASRFLPSLSSTHSEILTMINYDYHIWEP